MLKFDVDDISLKIAHVITMKFSRRVRASCGSLFVENICLLVVWINDESLS